MNNLYKYFTSDKVQHKDQSVSPPDADEKKEPRNSSKLFKCFKCRNGIFYSSRGLRNHQQWCKGAPKCNKYKRNEATSKCSASTEKNQAPENVKISGKVPDLRRLSDYVLQQSTSGEYTYVSKSSQPSTSANASVIDLENCDNSKSQELDCDASVIDRENCDNTKSQELDCDGSVIDRENCDNTKSQELDCDASVIEKIVILLKVNNSIVIIIKVNNSIVIIPVMYIHLLIVSQVIQMNLLVNQSTTVLVLPHLPEILIQLPK